VNHGAFGATLAPILKESNLWRQYCEIQPLRFFDRELFPLISYSIREMANYLKCPPSELYPLPNVTAGLNSVAQSFSLSLKKGDEVLCLSLTYGSTKKILSQLCVSTGATLVIVHIPLPVLSEEDVLLRVSAALSPGRTKLVILDHITSNTALVLPIKSLATACRSAGAVVVVDAAHTLFNQPVHLYRTLHDLYSINNKNNSSIGVANYADIWITNCHKWLCSPKGAAFMWLSPRVIYQMRPAIISHGFYLQEGSDRGYSEASKLLSGFVWDGCRDYSALLCVPSTLRFWTSFPQLPGQRSGGWEACRFYSQNLVSQACEFLKVQWGLSEDDFAGPPAMRLGVAMVLVPLPAIVRGRNTRIGQTDVDAFQLQELLHHEHRIEVPVKCLEGKLFIRISAHIYNSMEDYEHLARVVKSLH